MICLKRFLSFVFLCWCSLSFASGVSLRDKIGQMLIVGFHGKTVNADSPIAKAIDQTNIGGVILFDYDPQTKLFDKNISSPEQVALLNHTLQSLNHKANSTHHRKNLPLLISVDYEGGKVNRLKEEYGFPATISAKAIGNMPLKDVHKLAATMANTLKTSGFNLDFAPVLDVDVNSENPIVGKLERSFSNDPYIVGKYAHLFSKQFLNHGVQCVYKHFPGHGSSTADSHLGFVDVTDTWHEQELRPYQQLLAKEKHCGMIMTAHIVNRRLDASGVPATLSRTVLTGILRHELKFDGVIITDDMQMKSIADNYELETALTMTINAGADMIIFGNQLDNVKQDPSHLIDIIEKKVVMGEISASRIDEAYRHIIHLKKGLRS